ncbi:MAG TPA: YicC family protein [Candidatus Anaerostipes excrementavium]|uniref:YicC family protein n=1 Tax=Candidatus Anaerostipes excrementavium TaxID=2838463 RepID=A0A9D1WXK3_9FIRM|nr:YicC/YloC family endoribonuclease [uncultured Anaerostipes sp.]HIX69018.1 YicC family protein [Candidatus Anaerostipes excrementavium]
MIKSMTGFGHGEMSNAANQKVTIEMKAVNHRYCDISLKLPKKFTMFEAAIRKIMKEYVSRGKVDIYISFEDLSQTGIGLLYNREIAGEYMEIFRKMQEEFQIEMDITASAMARFPEVVTVEEKPQDEEVWWELIEASLREAAEKFVEARSTEGEHLKKDLLQKLDQMEEDVAFIESRSPDIIKEYRVKLEERVKEFLEDSSIEENRIAAEVALYADKMAVDEEIVRLQSHIRSMRDILRKGNGAVGRKLDFMAQEMNREANTILSKSSDADLAEHAIELKTNVEKVREQIQNIE